MKSIYKPLISKIALEDSVDLDTDAITSIPEDTPSWIKYLLSSDSGDSSIIVKPADDNSTEPVVTNNNFNTDTVAPKVGPVERNATTNIPKPDVVAESKEETQTPKEVVQQAITTQASFTPVRTNGKIDREKTKNAFKNHFLPIYKKVLKEKGISEEYAKMLVAQAGHESDWGSKPIGLHKNVTNNYIGVKVPSSQKGKGLGVISGTWEEYYGKRKDIFDEFRKFANSEDMVRYHIGLLSNKRYNAFTGDTALFADRVKAGGYATDSKYVEKLNRAIASMQKGAKFIKPDVLGQYSSYNDYTMPELPKNITKYFGKNAPNAREIIVQLKNAGWNPKQIGAYTGNVAAESTGNPHVINSIGATGLIQRLGDRKEPIRSIPSLDLPVQLQYDIDVMANNISRDEMYNEWPSRRKRNVFLKGTAPVKELTNILMKNYIRPAKKEQEISSNKRQTVARNVYNFLSK